MVNRPAHDQLLGPKSFPSISLTRNSACVTQCISRFQVSDSFPHCNLRRFQTPIPKPGRRLGAISPACRDSQSVTVYSKQPGETVMEVDEIETDARIPVLEIATCRPPNLSDRKADLRIMARRGPIRLRSSSHRCGYIPCGLASSACRCAGGMRPVWAEGSRCPRPLEPGRTGLGQW